MDRVTTAVGKNQEKKRWSPSRRHLASSRHFYGVVEALGIISLSYRASSPPATTVAQKLPSTPPPTITAITRSRSFRSSSSLASTAPAALSRTLSCTAEKTMARDSIRQKRSGAAPLTATTTAEERSLLSTPHFSGSKASYLSALVSQPA
ncbi:hypothetical protein QAD02_020959 [Eretmocerus hayati]|uniref:Uncharacterized protein n=1 Tax=Eretmocerus hayati TaxID=131215 RepID=A0ACC2PQT3_9HYME|nr:hypothetical protein QAD02_020959 [Eretmocerus hayati]